MNVIPTYLITLRPKFEAAERQAKALHLYHVNNFCHHNIEIPDISLETTKSYLSVSSSATVQSASLSHHHELLGRITALSLQADTGLFI
jgi:hypothetical protein